MSEKSVEGIVFEHPDELELVFVYFDSKEYALGYIEGAYDFGGWDGCLLSEVDAAQFVEDWPPERKAEAIQKIEDAKRRLIND